MSEPPITIVSGLPRSGTSMMMRMLESAGLEILSDGARAPDEDNPLGYYEFEPVKKLESDCRWVSGARGKVVKVVSPLLRHLPRGFHYRVIFMERDLREVLASQRRMLLRRGRPADEVPDEEMAGTFRRHLDRLRDWLARQPNFSVLYVDHREVVERPRDAASRVASFLGLPLDPERMAAAVDPSLYRQRR